MVDASAHQRTESGQKMKRNSVEVSQERYSVLSGNPATPTIHKKSYFFQLQILALFLCFPMALEGQMIVDCSGANPNAFTTISAALTQVTGPGAAILVSGTCNENVAVNNALNLSLGAYWGQTANLVGGLSINGSQGIYLYGLNVSNPAGTGISISSSRSVTLDSSSSNGNGFLGLNELNLSEVIVLGPASFDLNGGGGIQLESHSTLLLSDFAGATQISNNLGPGIWISQGSLVSSLGATTLANNVNSSNSLLGASQQPGWGLVLLGASIAQFGTCFGSNLFANNQGGGISLQENSELSLWSCGAPNQNVVQGNGGVGISAGFGSQVTLYDRVQVTGHAGPGVDVFGGSQLFSSGQNLFSQNGTPGDLRSAAIRLDGNSEAFLRGGQITANQGPGIMALMNSSADFTGLTFSGNSGGIITCDSSAYMVSDLPPAASRSVDCHTPHNLGSRHMSSPSAAIPDSTLIKSRQDQYRKMASPKAH